MDTPTIFEKQVELGNQLSKYNENIRKEGKRLKNADRIANWREKVGALWAEFTVNNDKLKENENELADEEYFTEQYFDGIELIYNAIISHLNLKAGVQRKNDENAGRAFNDSVQETGDNETRSNEEDSTESETDLELRTPKQVFFTPKASRSTAQPRELFKRFDKLTDNMDRTLNTIETTINDGHLALARMSIEDCESDWMEFKVTYNNITLLDIDELKKDEIYHEFNRIKMRYLRLTETVKENRRATGNNHRQQTPPTTAPAFKLDAIKIPKFHGNYEAWPTFSSLFETLIITNESINSVQKMQYLKSVLGGEAERAVAGLDITGNNFQKAWEILIERFDNKQGIREKQVRGLINLEPAISAFPRRVRNLHDKAKEYTALLEGITLDEFIIILIKSKLDTDLQTKYEEQRSDNETLKRFFVFLNQRCRILEAHEGENENRKVFPRDKRQNNTQIIQKCPHCNENHVIFFCDKFKALKPNERKDVVKQKALCLLCLRPNHTVASCSFKKMCPTCGKKHNGLLHFGEASKEDARMPRKDEPRFTRKSYATMTEQTTGKNDEKIACVTTGEESEEEILLSTAMVRIKLEHGWSEPVRALIDQGSTGSFCSERLVKQLGLPRKKTSCNIVGIGETPAERAKGSVRIEFTSRYPSSFVGKANLIIMNKVMKAVPSQDIDKNILEKTQLHDYVLADPDFWKAARIDLLLGSDVFADLLLYGVDKSHPKGLIAQETELSWMISGHTHRTNVGKKQMVCMVAIASEFEENMKKFWEIEELNEDASCERNEDDCVKYFRETVERDTTGRYVVALPFKSDIIPLGNSRKMAVAQLLQMENKFAKEPQLRKAYVEFMNEYIELGHMELNTEQQIDNERVCYLPHHAVFITDSTTTKLRTVFDASRKTSSGFSLNDKLLVGPKLQDDLANIMMRFRKHKIAFCADIAKMYRQILIREKDRAFQMILWREKPQDPIREYKLSTITYGMSAAPFLAVQTVLHHAEMESKNFPEACEVIKRDLYMDDVSSGTNDLDVAIKLQREITHVLALAGLPLRKWISNSKELLEKIPEEQREGAPVEIGDDENSISTLGLLWFHEADKLGFKIKENFQKKRLTKRVVLSEISKIYDPLGFLAPVTIYNKILMQQIWDSGLTWDDTVSDDIAKKWEKVQEQLHVLSTIRIDKWLKTDIHDEVELIGFADASTKAYAAVVYARVWKDGVANISLITAKTRVAPLKKVTLPRLELTAALLLAKLMKNVKMALNLQHAKAFYFSDSEVALAWIRGNPARWKAFVANRVTEIVQLTEKEEWRYVASKENSADCASRGLLPEQLINFDLWWQGPKFLMDQFASENDIDYQTDLERKNEKMVLNVQIERQNEIFERFSQLNRALRVVAWCKRFIDRLKKTQNMHYQKSLNPDEIIAARDSLVKLTQQQYCHNELLEISKSGKCNKTSRLSTLSPFVDSNGILRVGGRLENSDFCYDKKHPIIVPYGSKLADWIISDAHKRVMHGGNQLTLAQIRHTFWIPAGKRAVKNVINRCITCHRFKAKATQQLMGSLPKARTKMMLRPFTHTGTDLCGPVSLKMSTGRGQKVQKGYIVIFICMSTRAIHIEVVSDLGAEAFIAAFKRFVGRRGNVAHLYSDNGLNFVAANKILKLESEQAIRDYNLKIEDGLTQCNTKFNFNPPSAPWFGGIWERNIGSIKYHLKRTIGGRILTFEELSTVLAQIEACVNSRPICPLTESVDDLEALTPGHFLIGSALTAPLECDVLNVQENRLNKWELCNKLKQSFWRKWSDEYISNLQKRPKWNENNVNLEVGQLVLLMDEINPPLKWPLARITNTYPGADGLVRVVDIRARGKIYKRPVGKLALLPSERKVDKEEVEKNLNNKKSDPQSTEKMRKQEKIKTKRQRNTTSIGVWPAIATVFGLICLVFGEKNGFSIEKYNDNTCGFVEQCGDAFVAKGTWNIFAYVDMNDYTREVNDLHDIAKRLSELCAERKNLTKTEHSCTQFESLAKTKLNELDLIDKFITKETRKRSKRGVLATALCMGVAGIVGSALTHWFEARSEKERIDSMEQLLKEKASVLQVTAETVDRFAYDSTKLRDIAEREMYLATLFTEKTYELKRKQEKYMEILTKGTTTLDTNLLPYDMLSHHVEVINKRMKENSLFGQSIEEKTLTLYKVAKYQFGFAANTMIIDIKIPLVGERLKCERIQAINNKNGRIKLNAEYVLTNNKHDTYFVVTSKEMQYECTKMTGAVICDIKKVAHKAQTENICEYSVLSGSTKNCAIQPREKHEEWVNLKNNRWLFSFEKNTTVNITCRGKTKTMQLGGIGVINLNETCSIETKCMKIYEDMFTTSELNIQQNWRTVEFHETQYKPLGLEELSKSVAHFEENLKTYNTMHLAMVVAAVVFITIYFSFAMAMAHMKIWMRSVRGQADLFF